MKPKNTLPKGERLPVTPEERKRHIEKLAIAEYLDYFNDCKRREYKKSDKYQQAGELADKFSKRKK